MKNKLIRLIYLIGCLVMVTSCFNAENKDINEMNLIELHQYNQYLKNEHQSLMNDIDRLMEESDGKTYDEVVYIINKLNDEIIKSNVMITSESKSFFHSTSVSSGSGTIIKEDSDYYYVLTNNHVIYSLGNRVSYYIYDYLNNEYSNASVLFADANYDMALLRFSKGKSKLLVTPFALQDAKVKENIIVIGQPLGQRNTITFGEVLSYGKVDCDSCGINESNINYDCIFYDAITSNGNSGGMILNYEYELVGVVTFGMNGANGDYLHGAGSPISRVKEFLLLNQFEVGDSNA